MRARRALVGLAVLAVAAAGCGAGGDRPSILGKEELVIGVKPDQPGLGLKRQDGAYEGFDVDVAKEVAKRVAGSGVRVRFVDAPSSERERMLRSREVDLVVASYSITPKRKTQVGFAGPYYVAHQDILVRRSETRINNVRDLSGRTLCDVTGSNSYRRVREEKKIAVRPVESASYSECVDKLRNGVVDAVSTDDLILAGFAASQAGQFKIVNRPFTDERYGIGIHRDDIDGCEAVNKAITQMYQDGTAKKLLDKWFGPTDLEYTTTVPEFEGCG
jgi:ABC-type amino acid transport/signal transduction systems, periplasmic component/domain